MLPTAFLCMGCTHRSVQQVAFQLSVGHEMSEGSAHLAVLYLLLLLFLFLFCAIYIVLLDASCANPGV